MSIELLLSKLDKVKKSGPNRWTCACPAHADKSPSMHVLLADDGKILINCKAGCGAYDILGAIGLEFQDLFPDTAEFSPSQPKVLLPSEALLLLRQEAQIVLACAIQLTKGELTVGDFQRLHKSMQTINKIQGMTR